MNSIMDFSITSNESYVEIKLAGSADHHGFSNLIDSVLESAEWTPGTPVLLDQTELTMEQFSSIDMKSLADLCGFKTSDDITDKLALLSGSDCLYGLSRVWISFVEAQWNVTAQPFRSREKALAWLTT